MHAVSSISCPATKRWPDWKVRSAVSCTAQRQTGRAPTAGSNMQQSGVDGSWKQAKQSTVNWKLVAHRNQQQLDRVLTKYRYEKKIHEAESVYRLERVRILEESLRLNQQSMEEVVTAELLWGRGLLHMRGLIEYAEHALLRDFPLRDPCTREATWVKILEHNDELLSDMKGAVDSMATIPEFAHRIVELHAHLSKPEYKETRDYQAHWSGVDIPTKMVTPEQEQLLLCIGKAAYVRCYTGPAPIRGWQPGGVKPDVRRTSSGSNGSSGNHGLVV